MAENENVQGQPSTKLEVPAASTQPGATSSSGSASPPIKHPWWGEMTSWVGQRPWPFTLFIGLIVLASIAWLPETWQNTRIVDILLPLLTLVWVALLFAWFVTCFTGDAFENRTREIEFAYFFMVLSFGLVTVMIADIGKAKKFGVVEGCVESFDDNPSSVSCAFPIKAPRLGEARSAANGKGDAPAGKGAVPDKKGAAPAGKGAALADKGPASGNKGAEPADNGGGATDRNVAGGSTADQPEAGTPIPTRYNALTYAELKSIYLANQNYHYLLNIAGHLDELISEPMRIKCRDCKPGQTEVRADCDECKSAVYAVRGGLPVPVYFILLALIGGAISLAKNVPGIQKRSDLDWQGTATEPRLAPGEVRELLLFQVLQFVSAPLLAVAAYHTIKPESLGTTVALGFLVGFGSDQILASIRSMVKGAQAPAAAQATVTSSITGTVTQGNIPVANAAVELLGTTLTAKTNAKGEFSLIAVPVKNDPYMLKASAAGKEKEVPVTVKDAAPVKDLKIELA